MQRCNFPSDPRFLFIYFFFLQHTHTYGAFNLLAWKSPHGFPAQSPSTIYLDALSIAPFLVESPAFNSNCLFCPFRPQLQFTIWSKGERRWSVELKLSLLRTNSGNLQSSVGGLILWARWWFWHAVILFHWSPPRPSAPSSSLSGRCIPPSTLTDAHVQQRCKRKRAEYTRTMHMHAGHRIRFRQFPSPSL